MRARSIKSAGTGGNVIRRNVIWLIALAIAILFDILFWGHTPGVSFFLFVVLCFTAGIFTAWISGVRPMPAGLALLPAILATAAVTFLRAEVYTIFFAFCMTLLLMAVLAASYKSGRWPFYGIADHILSWFRLGADAALHPALLPPEKPAAGAPTQPSSIRRQLWPVLRGLALALPVVLIFAALFASADPMFDRLLRSVFNLDRLPEYLFRLTYILAGTYLLTGIFLHAILASRDERPAYPGRERIRPFFGITESLVVLGAVVGLFTVFVAVQFRYFFGGAGNIGAEGFTFSEYARRGFGELVAAAFLSLLLLLGLGTLTRREGARERNVFTVLAVALVALVIVVLVSSFQRLLLYENAYGFTNLRLYTHVFIVWLGLLLVALAALEIAGRIRYFSAAAIVAAFGFSMTLAVINVDGTIAAQNGERARNGYSLDTDFLNTLSVDAVPAILALYDKSTPPEKDAIGAGLSCRLTVMEAEDGTAWQSFRLPYAEALRLLRESGVGDAYPVFIGQGNPYVEVGGHKEYCWNLLSAD
jgi:hypothetical protein